MTTRFRLCGALIVSAASSIAFAQSEIVEPIDQIIVTGARAPIDLNRLGSASTVITRDDIERRQARYLTDLLRTVPGFAVSHTGVTGSQTQVRVRGSEANHVLVLIDGVRANDPGTGDEFRWEHLTVSGVERVEIVRGAQSSLWGSDAVGAVVNVITQPGGAARSSASAYAEAGSNSSLNAGFDGRIAGTGWTIGAALENLDTDGQNISRVGSERDGAELTTASVSARLSPSERWTFTGGLRATDAASEFDPVDFFTTGLPADGDRVTESDNLLAYVTGSFGSQSGRLVHRLSARYYDSEHRNLVDGGFDSSTASERYRVSYQADLRLRDDDVLSLALEREHTDFSQRGIAVFGDPNQDQEMDVTSFVAEYQYLSGERLSWLASARYDDNSDFEPVLTGRVSVSYALSAETRVRLGVGRGHKNPTFTERFGFFPGQFVGNPNLDPERSTSYDVGLDQSLLDGALQVGLTVFQHDLDDEINGFVFDPTTFLSTAENRPGESDRSGVELTAQWNAGNGLSLGGSYTYTDAHEENAAGIELRETRRPRHTGNVTLAYRSNGGRFDANLAADYGGSRIDTFFPPFPEAPMRVELDDHWLLDLTLQFHVSSNLSLFARGSNLLDDDYEQVFGYQTLGRTGFAGIRANFGR